MGTLSVRRRSGSIDGTSRFVTFAKQKSLQNREAHVFFSVTWRDELLFVHNLPNHLLHANIVPCNQSLADWRKADHIVITIYSLIIIYPDNHSPNPQRVVFMLVTWLNYAAFESLTLSLDVLSHELGISCKLFKREMFTICKEEKDTRGLLRLIRTLRTTQLWLVFSLTVR